MNKADSAFTIIRYLTRNRFAFPLIMTVIMVSTLGSFLLIDYLIFSYSTAQLALENADRKIQERNQFLQSYTQNAEDILWSIRDNTIFQEYLLSPATSHYANDLLLSVARANPSIMQIRFIDAQGQEQIRHDRDSFSSQPHPAKQLRNKRNRYYFADSVGKPEKVWFSALDLNIEFGKIEVPFKPTYRAILPIQHNETFAGILIVNFFAQPMLEKLFHTSLYDGILADSEGYALQHYQKNKSWGYYQDPKVHIDQAHLEAVKHTAYQTDEFISRQLELPFANSLTLILKLNDTYVAQQEARRARQLLTVSLIVALLSLFVTLAVDRFVQLLSRQIAEQEAEMKLLEAKQAKQETLLIQQARLADMGNMLSMIAHQWRQPLSTAMVILSNVKDLMRDEPTKQEPPMKLLSKAEDTLFFMSETIDDFRNFFKQSKEKTEFDLLQSVYSAYKIIGSQLRHDAVHTQVDLEPLHQPVQQITLEHEQDTKPSSLPAFPCIGYPNEFQQSLLALLDNAKDAMQNNTAEKHLVITIREREHQYDILMKDNGSGITQADAARIFEPYFTTKQKLNGTGLGLYMCKMIIEKSFDGTIKVDSDPDQGTVFTITLDKHKQENHNEDD